MLLCRQRHPIDPKIWRPFRYFFSFNMREITNISNSPPIKTCILPQRHLEWQNFSNIIAPKLTQNKPKLSYILGSASWHLIPLKTVMYPGIGFLTLNPSQRVQNSKITDCCNFYSWSIYSPVMSLLQSYTYAWCQGQLAPWFWHISGHGSVQNQQIFWAENSGSAWRSYWLLFYLLWSSS